MEGYATDFTPTTIANSPNFMSYVAGIRYVHATKRVHVLLTTNNSNLFTSSYSAYGNFDVSALSESVAHHFMFDVIYANRIKTWIDGIAASDVSLSTGASTINYFNGSVDMRYVNGVAAIGASTGNDLISCPSTNARIAVGMFYDAPITDADATAHYNALMVGSTPIVTGYAREIITYAPELYFRMNDPDATNGIRSDYLMDNVTYDRPLMYGAGSATFGVATPVIGGTGIRFQSGVGVRSNYVGGGTNNPYEFSICALIKPEVATPSAIETILTLTDSAETILRRSATKYFRKALCTISRRCSDRHACIYCYYAFDKCV